MLIAAWILAVSTAVLAVGGPVAYLQWRADRRRERERLQLEAAQRERDGFLKDASDRFVSKDSVKSTTTVGVIGLVIGFLLWLDGRKPKPPGVG